MDWILGLREETGVPHTLAAFNVGTEKFGLMSQMSPKDPTAGGNPIPIDEASCRNLFEAAHEGRL